MRESNSRDKKSKGFYQTFPCRETWPKKVMQRERE